MTSGLEDSGFKNIIELFGAQSRKTKDDTEEVKVSDMGFPQGADISTINSRIKQMGYEGFPKEQLLREAHSRKFYTGNASFVLKKKK